MARTKRIRMQKLLAGPNGCMEADSVHVVDAAFADLLIKDRAAVEVDASDLTPEDKARESADPKAPEAKDRKTEPVRNAGASSKEEELDDPEVHAPKANTPGAHAPHHRGR